MTTAASDAPRCSHSRHLSPPFRGPGRARAVDGTRAPMSHADRLFWGLLLVWAAVVVAADGLDLVPNVGTTDGWNWFFLGAGTLAAVGCIRDLLVRPRRALELWDWAIAAGLLVVGLDGFPSASIVIAVMALLLGALILVAGERRTSPTAQGDPS